MAVEENVAIDRVDGTVHGSTAHDERGCQVPVGASTVSQPAGSPDADERAVSSGVLDEMFSILSHELRSPLTTIKGSARTLLRHGATLDASAHQQLLVDIDHEANRLHRLVDNLLELARAGAGAFRAEPHALDLLLRRICAEAVPSVGERSLRARVPSSLPLVAVDPVRIEQVVRNLIDNAVKFTARDGSIDVHAAAQGDRVLVTVRDNGVGIAEEYLGRVFERFFKVDPPGQAVAGAGLGLAICRRFVELHGGEIEIESAVGTGTAVTFSLPVAGREVG